MLRVRQQVSATAIYSISAYIPSPPPPLRAIDCAAGVARVTSGLLMHKFDVVDVLEPLPHFLAEARRRLASKSHRGQFFEMGLQVGGGREITGMRGV